MRRPTVSALAFLAFAAAHAAQPFAWRGLMLDESRHFFGKDPVKRILDRMSKEDYNYFHWHLTDHQGWRLQIRRYPGLTLDEKALMWKIWPRATALSKVLSDRKKGDCGDEGE